jgi:hypothetical protein
MFFAPRYFATRYFAPRYFPGGGEPPIPRVPPYSATLNVNRIGATVSVQKANPNAAVSRAQASLTRSDA